MSNQSEISLLTEENPDRNTIFPIKYLDIWEQYESQRANFWWDTDIAFTIQDEKDWNSLTDNERQFMEHIMAFFASADGIVMENLASRFLHEFQLPEAKAYFTLQLMIEHIHALTYAKLLDGYVKDKDRKMELFKANQNIPFIKAKTDWATKWMNSKASLAERLVAFVCVEGVHFQGEFCAIFWMKEKKKLNALGLSNYLIARDENNHTTTGTIFYKNYIPATQKLTDARVHEIVREAVDVEIGFINEVLDCALIGMNKTDMSMYIKYVANDLCNKLGHSPAYQGDIICPFDFMDRLCFNSKENFFETRVSSYRQKRSDTVIDIENMNFNLDF